MTDIETGAVAKIHPGKPFVWRMAISGLVFTAAPARAGELWIDYLEERFDICAPVEGTSSFDPLAADFLRDQLYELDKFMPSEEWGPSRSLDAEGQRSTHFDAARLRELNEWLEQVEGIVALTFPPLEKHRRISEGQTEIIEVTTASIQNGPRSPHAPLREAFGNAFIGGWHLMEDSGALAGPALLKFLDARRDAARLLSGLTDKPLKTIESDELLLAVERVETGYAQLRPLLFGFVDWEGFPRALEMQQWAVCSTTREDDQ